ncbi:MAG TPA: hypothetical protein VLJ39_21505 [Tepidisphaeraceae bacterium]|nr:hypothetical protein [Tepidisphaeraceae bacterium]
MGLALTHDDPLRLTRCMRCGYGLDTLAPRGRCPECGSPYSPETVVLYSTSYDHLALGSRGLSTGGYVLMGLLMAGYSRMWLQTRSPFLLLWTGCFLAQIVLGLCWRWTVMRHSPEGGFLQCRFNASGFVQCDIPDEMAGTMGLGTILRWSSFAYLIPGVVFVVAPFTSPLHMLLKAALILAVPLIAFGFRRFRRPPIPHSSPLTRALTHGLTAGLIPPSPVAWADVERYAIHPIVGWPNRHLIRITGKRGSSGTTLVAELRCTTEQAKKLSRRIAMWLRAAREDPG